MSKVDQIMSYVEDIEGSLNEGEGLLLYNLAKNCKDGVIVEIGSWKGRSTILLAKGSKAGNKVRVYAIDPHTGSFAHKAELGHVWTFDEFKRNITKADVGDIVIPVVKTSEEAIGLLDLPIGLLFIDGEHDYEYVKKDFDLWYPKVVVDGVVVFHDSFGDWKEVKKVVRDSIHSSRNFKGIGFVDSSTYAIKVERNSFFDCVRSWYVYYLKEVYWYSHGFFVCLPKPIKRILRSIIAMVQ